MRLISLVLFLGIAGGLTYPATKKGDVVDDYFGVKVANPYRWLEDDNAADTKAWVEAQNKVTQDFLGQVAERERIKTRLTKLWNFERYSVPWKKGPFYFYSKNDGLQNQAVFYVTKDLNAQPRVLLDPNTLSKDGTVALADTVASEDGKRLAYALSEAGSDWYVWHVRDVESGKDLADELKWTKFTSAAWLHDGSGFFYARYPEPKGGDELKGVNKNQKIYLHKLGQKQSQDALVYERPDKPDWGFSSEVTDDGRYLIISQHEGTEHKNRLFVKDLTKADAKVETFLDAFDAAYNVVGNDGDTFYVHTDNAAPRFRLVAIDKRTPDSKRWKTLISETTTNRDVLAQARLVAERFAITWRTDAHETLRLYGLDGKPENDIPLPTLGTVGALSGERKDAEAFYAFTSFTYPRTIYRYDSKAKTATVLKQPKVDFKPDEYETKQVFYKSKDGTSVPMFIVHKKGLVLDGNNPTNLYGYGGFEISLTPTFSPATLAWLELGGVYAMPNLRGGGEYGREWHDAGRLKNKQNVFDDFIAAAEWLVANKYTRPAKLAISGGSNGGLLVGATMTQRPELFGAAIPAVGVMDMLRFHKFTIGWAWKSDYGSSETKEGFDVLYKYSPLHNLKPGTKYPATLVLTGDHDDRVVPAHSHKFTATLQAAQAGSAPVLTRIETRAGHGSGKPTTKQIEERADVMSFLLRVLEMKLQS